MSLYLGIEGGGTKSRAHLMDAQTVEIGNFEGGPTNYQAVGFESAFSNLKTLIQASLSNSAGHDVCIFAALAGLDTPRDVGLWQEAVNKDQYFSGSSPIQKMWFGNDIEAAFRSGSERQEAVALISGTGSACFGRNKKGETTKSSGMNYLLADQGSGYELGLFALKQITKELDGRAPRGVLTQLFFDKYQIMSLEELHDLVYGQNIDCSWIPDLVRDDSESSGDDKRDVGKDKGGFWDKTEIAQVALIVSSAADQKDPWALWICDQAV